MDSERLMRAYKETRQYRSASEAVVTAHQQTCHCQKRVLRKDLKVDNEVALLMFTGSFSQATPPEREAQAESTGECQPLTYRCEDTTGSRRFGGGGEKHGTGHGTLTCKTLTNFCMEFQERVGTAQSCINHFVVFISATDHPLGYLANCYMLPEEVILPGKRG
ncbi:hypothetical protein UY3_06688 [Chelonia mydas]|uniref:Uncharacterized protein n=1 Tax=Chelonia mydas TaxID=8469 RepID=M7BDX8_CHEMY|nr:hypothetical protein UY3_06688 [Chelonia mydas]